MFWRRLAFSMSVLALLLQPACGDGTSNDGAESDAGGSTFQYRSIHAANHRGICGITDSGSLVCKGSSTFPSDPGEEYFVSESSEWVRASVAQDHFCALSKSNTVKCWGSNNQGQSMVPSGNYDAVAAGISLTCLLDGAGRVECLGRDDYGLLEPPEASAREIHAGGNGFACLLTASGGARCWGNDTFGTLETPSGTFKTLSVGNYHACGILEDDSVECWGTGSEPDAMEPGFATQQAIPPSGEFTEIAAGKNHTCALDASGEATCWGLGTDPNSEEGGTNARFDHDQASPPDATFRQIVAGADHSCGLLESGGVRCWGRDPAELTLP